MQISGSRLKKGLVVCGIVAAALTFAYHVSIYPMDLRVYHFGARGVFDGSRPVYGVTSGLGWPMHYRYPPLFLLLFAPLAVLPLGLAASVWVAAKIGVLAGLLHALRRSAVATASGYIVSFLFIAPYIVEEFRYGNAQFFVLALTIGGLLSLRRQPVLAGASLGLAISIKVWPVFFLPYLAVRREWRAAGLTLGFVLILALLPSLYFGFGENFNLLGQWFAQEFRTQLGEIEIWFPNQSLRGVLMRYLTVIDYSQLPDSNYAQVNVASLSPATVRRIWMVLAGGIYAGFLALANRRRNSDGWLDHGLAFCLVALLEPFTQKYALAVLLWPAIAAGALTKQRRFRVLLYGATVFALIQPLAPGASAQRFLQVLGMDFAAASLLTAALVLACLKTSRERLTEKQTPLLG